MISITEKLVLDPIQNLSQPQNSCIESELATRIIGVATSIFALIDLVANIVAVTGATVYILAKSIVCCYNPADYQFLSDSILNIFKFTMLTAFGSVFGIFIPNCLVSTCFKNDSDTTAPTPPVPLVVPPSPRAGSVTPPPSPVSSDSGIRSSSPVVVPLITQPVRTGPGAPTTRIPPVTTILPGTGRSPASTSSPGSAVTSPLDLTSSLVRAHFDGTYTPSKGAGSLATVRAIDIAAEDEALERLLVLAELVQSGESSIIIDGEEVSVIQALKDFLASATIHTKMRFYEIFNEDVPEYAEVRKEFASIIFQSKYFTVVRPVVWLSDRELIDAGDRLPTAATLRSTLASKGITWNDNFHKGFYYHATWALTNVSSILTGKKLEVRRGGYFGAFISTRPEHLSYGKYVFAFKEKIAHASAQAAATMPAAEDGYWCGMSQDIQINPDTLAYIMVATPEVGQTMAQTITNLKSEITRLVQAGIIEREIPVIEVGDIEPHRVALLSLNRGIPKSWAKPGGPGLYPLADPDV